MNTIPLAILLALLAACLFAAAVARQHAAVRAHDHGGALTLRGLGDTVRSRGWLTGTGFAVLGSGLHVLALSLAPMVIVQPLGVLSLVLTVLFTARARRAPIARPVRLAVLAVCAGVFGFVALAVSPAVATSVAVPGAVHLAALAAVAVAALGLRAGGQARCAVLAASAAVLFGLGSVLTKSATGQLFTAQPQLGGLLIAAEAGLLLAFGGWVMHQAYAAGPTAVVVGAVTVLDPLTAVSTGLLFYGEAAYLTPATAAGQAALALLAVGGVVVLAKSVPDQRELTEEPAMPRRRGHTGSGLRIVLGADTFPPDVNGAANFAGRLAHGLAARGHEVHVICPAPDGKAATVRAGGITLHHLPARRTPFHPDFRISLPWQANRAVPDLLAGLDPDLVHVQSHFPVGRAVLRAATARNIPAVATNHFMPENLFGYLKIPAALRRGLARLAWRDLVRVYREAAVVTAPTPRAVELLHANHLPGQARAISCGIDIDHYAAPRPVKSASDGCAVLFVGRLDAEKNVPELLHALARVPGLRAELVGDGSCRARLEKLAAELGVTGRVRFHGVVSDADLVRAYRRADVFCMPGTAELQSLATMEAMSAGLPVVAADAMALPHLVRPGDNGFLYPPGDPDALAVHLRTLAADPQLRARLGAASTRLIARHALTATLTAFEGVYAELVTVPAPVLSGIPA
ncbi:glycosyltransferase [Crossiella sp. CA-258035]|uniref:glycosyltransferase n=1 Tax=Crossiella sp. CA-258035 TaxID=2981138 RepID=UPI0024BCF45B|nr:glycosyltransferase [Crossiella sp. CA-258035]WHT22439.1 glycosyltransferase [Crossiella sp. CA-258035]